jgi:hypothetical protein
MLMGRAHVGFVYRLLPFHDDVESVRYSIGVHFVGIVCGALVLAAVVKTVWCALSELGSEPFLRCTRVCVRLQVLVRV